MTAAAPAFPELPLWRVVVKLLRLRFLIYTSSFKRAKKAKKFWMVFGWIALFLFFAGVLTGTIFLLIFLKSPAVASAAGDFRPLIDAVPSLIIAGAFLTILLTSFGVLLQGLYLAGDMDFLLTSPVPIRAVFVSKMLMAILPNFALIALIGIPILFGIGIGAGYNILFYPLALIVLAFLALSAAGMSSLLVMGIVRVIPAKRVAEILAFFGAIISVTCSQWGNLSHGFDYSKAPAMVSGRMGTIEKLLGPYSPLAWAGRGLLDIGTGHWLTGILFTLITLVLSGGVFWFALTTAERLYYSGWASIQGVERKKKKTLRSPKNGRSASPAELVLPASLSNTSGLAAVPAAVQVTPRRDLLQNLLPSQTRAVIYKDWLTLRRDLRSMSQVVTPLIFGLIYGFLLLRSGGEPGAGRGEAPEAGMEIMRSLLSFGGVGISVFMGWSLLSRLALMSFSSEGKSYWLIKTAPVSAGKLLLGKFILALVPSLAIGWVFLLAMTILEGNSLSTAWYGFPVVALINAGLTGISLAFGVASAKLDWTDPRRMGGGGWTGCLSGFVSFAYIILILGIFLAPTLILSIPQEYLPSWLSQIPVWIGQLIGLSVGGVISLLCTVLPPILVRRRVESIGEGQL